MKILILCLFLTSCATSYKVKRCDVTDGIIHCSEAQVKSRREFADGVQVVYKDGEFKFISGAVKNADNPLEQAGAMALLKLMEQVEIK